MRAEGRRCRRNTAAVVRDRERGPDPDEKSWAWRFAARRKSTRRATMVAVLVAALMMMTAGIALAESFRGDDGPNTIRGTDESDRIEGLAGDDLFGLGGGDDDIYGGGRDRIDAGRGDDYVDVQGDGRVDQVDCGSGRDVVRANPEDNLAANCEVSKAVVGLK